MKKILICGIVIVFLGALILTSYILRKTNSPEILAENLIGDIFNVSYEVALEEYQYKHKESGNPKDLDRIDYIYRDDIFRKYFSEDRYNAFSNTGYNLLHHTKVREHEFNIVLKSFELDIRDSYDENIKTCYFTVTYELEFLDDTKKSIYETSNGELTMINVDDTWLIHAILLRLNELELK